MCRTRLALRRFIGVALLLGVPGACATTATPPPGQAVASSGSAVVSADPVPDPVEAGPTPNALLPPPATTAAPVSSLSDDFASWKDPAAIQQLAHDCTYAVTLDPPLQCNLELEQSCVYDPCFGKTQKCHEACSKTCGQCDQRCVSSCSACAAHCSDDACRLACAKTTGACRQGCLDSRDTCATASCAKQVAGCMPEEIRKWKAGHCGGKCPAWEECAKKCFGTLQSCESACNGGAAPADDAPETPCTQACMAKLKTECRPRCDAQMGRCDPGYCFQGVGPDGT